MKNNKGIQIFRWTLRGISAILILFFLFMAFAHLFSPEESAAGGSLSVSDALQLLMFGLMILGLALAWKWELKGGVMALMAYAFMAVINPTTLLKGGLLYLYPITAILFILLWAISRKATDKG